MDRYQFEGYISDYIENALSISKRKEFEQYLTDHPEAQEEVDAVKGAIDSLKSLPKVSTSPEFMNNLESRIAQHPDVLPIEQKTKRPLIFGFTPLTATMMSLVVLAIVFVSYELLPTGTTSPVAIPSQITSNTVLPTTTTNTPPISTVNTQSTIAEAEDDSSLNSDELLREQPDFDDKINYVKTQ